MFSYWMDIMQHKNSYKRGILILGRKSLEVRSTASLKISEAAFCIFKGYEKRYSIVFNI